MTIGKHLAFPIFNSKGECEYDSSGLSIREYFAAMAMQGILANAEWAKTFTEDDFDEFRDRVSSASSEMADALIESLNKPINNE